MKLKIFIGTQLTDLQLYVSVLTRFEASTGNLQCRDVVLLAQNSRMASVLLAQAHPEWDMQSLTCLTDMAWFDTIILADNWQQAAVLRQFVIPNIESVSEEGAPPDPDGNDVASTFRKRRPYLN